MIAYVEKSLSGVDGLAALRLLRMLRILKLTKSLPKLRSIISALMEGFGSVGWIVCLIGVFNYIAACIGMFLFAKSDPFHFGTLTKTLLTVWRIETLDTWEDVMNINMVRTSPLTEHFTK